MKPLLLYFFGNAFAIGLIALCLKSGMEGPFFGFLAIAVIVFINAALYDIATTK